MRRRHSLHPSLSAAKKEFVTRRRFLGVSGMAGLSLFWRDLQRAAATTTPGAGGSARSVILIFNAGAPSHLDLWDMKPLAPDNIRGQFQPAATNVPGIHISEL